MTTATKTKLTTQRLHRVIRSKLGVLSSKHSRSQRIDRTTYDVQAGSYVSLFLRAPAGGDLMAEAAMGGELRIENYEHKNHSTKR